MTSSAVLSNMSSDHPHPFPIDPASSASVEQQPPRKRRRRTAGGGASDDCFACRNRGVQCDRKRPYCTQCIDIGKECSGYKTTLTWGVGVASRGKLRGLACPVANKNVDGSDTSPIDTEERRRKSSSSKPVKREEPESEHGLSTFSSAIPLAEPATTSADALSQTYPPSTIPLGSPPTSNGWQIPDFQDRRHRPRPVAARHLSLGHPSIQHIQTSLAPQYDSLSMPQSARSFSSFAESEFYSPLEYPHTPTSVPFAEQLPIPMSTPIPDQQLTASSTDVFGTHPVPVDPYTNNISAAMDPGNSLNAFSSPNGMPSSPNELTGLEGGFFNRLSSYLDPVSEEHSTLDTFALSTVQTKEEDYSEIDQLGLSLMDSRFASPFFSMSPRMQSLMEYYSRHICPHLVTFDGPENPYRKHILQLAVNNDCLQNAIAALSTNNFRMRKKEPKQIGFVEELTDAFNSDATKDWNEPTPEESCYKQMSIEQLNMQLFGTDVAQDDSVLATLLILCLFHACDSGFSKFKTQLAGVQMLLSYRRPNTQSDFTRWVEMFFMWFDVMTSAVNDREMQIQGESLAMLDFSANLGALEQYSGCDGRLFKLIARLGRLNLLAQGRPVRGQSHPKPTSHPPKAPRSLHPADYDNLDGNGWGHAITDDDPEPRPDFWTEWHDIRNRLLTWQMDLPPTTPLDPASRDLLHINETFRLSALLYTERLGHPLLPSSHDQFQRLVAQVLAYITALPVTSCVNKFLMWPLFIAGTECVDENQRAFIRRRCQDLTEESGFFNNISSLWVLEKVWREVGRNVRGSEAEEVKARRRDSEASVSGRYGQAFRWRKAMDRHDGEYIVL